MYGEEVVEFPQREYREVEIDGSFAEDRNECVGDDIIRAIATKPQKNPTAKKQNQR